MSHYIAIDIGGTKTSSAIIDAQSEKVLYYKSQKTKSGYHLFPKFLGEVIKWQLNNAASEGISVNQRVLLALPGNFETGEDVRYKSGSGRQLILADESFEDSNITSWLMSNIPKNYKCFAMNDAKAQSIGAIFSLWRDEFKQQVILFISPGTGLGGALVKMGDDPKDFEFICDGHIYDIMIKIRDQKVMAEDILSGRGIYEKTGLEAETINMSDDLFNQHMSTIHDCGTCLIELIQTVLAASVEKERPQNNWTLLEKHAAAKTSIIILGGSIGTKGQIAQYLKLRLNKFKQLNVLTSNEPDKNALLGTLLIAQKN